ncbi:hypothetical protein [Geomonas propionica]|uniref:Lipoprotein n=1 Tax=Geomonas propionica TaxID=2798582 RepID=A0ABS0YS82_9BACT|nr:hypothetical protein [Geomonas propionica]MBJ6800817.1 hypothetical protein [Geomonas propionica]
MKRQVIAAAAAVMAVGMLAGCGGGSSSTSAKVAGKVADGYLEKATVFLDKNNNYRLDEGEPNTQTDANGAYTLTVDPADIGKYPIVALAVKAVTIDHDTGLSVAHSYLLSLPKDSVSGTVSSNFISPITTQVREMMETGNYTMDQAMDQLHQKLNLSQNTNLMADYMAGAGQNQTLHATAQNMATLMGGQMGLVYQAGSDTVVDVNRYRGMMGAMFSNMSSVRAATTDADMKLLMDQMSSDLNTIMIGQPFHNMSSYFGGMMGGGRMMGQ